MTYVNTANFVSLPSGSFLQPTAKPCFKNKKAYAYKISRFLLHRKYFPKILF